MISHRPRATVRSLEAVTKQSWWRRTTRPLRVRVILWNAGVVLFTSLTLLLAVRVQVEFTLRAELDGILLDELEEAAGEIAPGNNFPATLDEVVLTRIVDRETYGHGHLQEYVEILSADGEVLAINRTAPLNRPSPMELPNKTPLTIGGYRIVKQSLPKNTQPARAVVTVGAQASMIDDQMRTLDRIVILTALTSLIAAPLVGYWLAGKAIDPVSQMTATAAGLHPEKLDERLPIRGTGDELDQLAMTVNQLLDRIFAYLQEHRESLANAAHELRSPLAAIRSSVEVTLQQPRPVAEYEELLESIIEQGAALEILVNQLLLISESEREHLETHSSVLDLRDVVSRSASMFRGVAELKEITFTADDLRSAEVAGNKFHLREVVNNLLDNAIKFTETGGTVRVTLQEDAGAQEAVLTIRDSGMGIAAEDLPRVFDRFFRGDRSRSRDTPGTGLGLAICKAVVEGHGGTIRVESGASGTMFEVRLPLASHPASRRISSSEPSAASDTSPHN
ncbi:sensor histidine kinase [Planctomyces sp. SH-PL14]|uniref:sensor histidine kinase n=1 Tax=Planctomyces sp. SH-PL14 TaxID=1632864 RepID=UPI00078DA3A2|nr:ATP-binding protein [Planctomyces sp. SH-PL14]AMV16801.1 Sensor kinase CusS [Planctomyces sp. SH-PL14]